MAQYIKSINTLFDPKSLNDMPFGCFVDIAPLLGVKSPQKNNFGSVIIGIIKPNGRRIKFAMSKWQIET